MHRTILMACWSALMLLAMPARAESSEHLAIDRKQIKVWTVDVPGQPMRGFRAVTTVRSSLGGLVALLMDAEAAPRWVYRMEQMRLAAVDERAGIFVVYAEVDFWPLRNRDTVVTGRITQDPQLLAVTLESRNIELDALPPVEGRQRMPSMWGRWDFRPLGNGLVEVTMSGQADPGGSIPAFLVNLMIEDTPFETLQGLRRVIGESRYQQARVAGIREPR